MQGISEPSNSGDTETGEEVSSSFNLGQGGGQGNGGKNFRTDFLYWKILEVPLSQWDCQGVDNRRALKVPVTLNQFQLRSGVRTQRPMGLWELFPQCGENRPALKPWTTWGAQMRGRAFHLKPLHQPRWKRHPGSAHFGFHSGPSIN